MNSMTSEGRPYAEALHGREESVSRVLHAAMRQDAARCAVVNRTHRVVREQAMNLQEQRRRTRSLWVPLAIFSLLMITSCYAIWGLLDGYDVTSSGFPDASDQLILLLLWSLPVTAAILGLAWFRRAKNRSFGGSPGNENEVQP